MKKYLGLFLVSFLGGAFAIGIYKFYIEDTPQVVGRTSEVPTYIPATYTNPRVANAISAENVDFTNAAEKTIHAVVHVKNVSKSRSSGGSSILDFFYGAESNGSKGRERTEIGTGSGVIISPDGYIVTNNHVIANASKLEVILNNNKTYEAELIGKDPVTDIALIKINSDQKFPFLAFGDSDNTKIGEWVLAVGNPFNLTSTVTAGIISAKARDLNEDDRKNQSFIQTDAAVNPGNSGGALVNTNGDLIGINTAITSQTGSFVGYAFAVPSNIAKKIVDDLLEYGDVQQGILGILGTGLNNIPNEELEKLKVNDTEGVYVSDVVIDSGADKAGLKEGDIIKKIDNVKISKFSDLTGYISSKRPNDVVRVTIERGSNTKTIAVTLLKNQTYRVPRYGFSVQNLSKSDIKAFGIEKGVFITTERRDRFRSLNGKILLEVDDKKITSVGDVEKIFKGYSDSEGPESIVIIDAGGEKERIIFE